MRSSPRAADGGAAGPRCRAAGRRGAGRCGCPRVGGRRGVDLLARRRGARRGAGRSPAAYESPDPGRRARSAPSCRATIPAEAGPEVIAAPVGPTRAASPARAGRPHRQPGGNVPGGHGPVVPGPGASGSGPGVRRATTSGGSCSPRFRRRHRRPGHRRPLWTRHECQRAPATGRRLPRRRPAAGPEGGGGVGRPPGTRCWHRVHRAPGRGAGRLPAGGAATIPTTAATASVPGPQRCMGGARRPGPPPGLRPPDRPAARRPAAHRGDPPPTSTTPTGLRASTTSPTARPGR
jgi:hypothetical protein